MGAMKEIYAALDERWPQVLARMEADPTIEDVLLGQWPSLADIAAGKLSIDGAISRAAAATSSPGPYTPQAWDARVFVASDAGASRSHP
jgi:hypothetical protein